MNAEERDDGQEAAAEGAAAEADVAGELAAALRESGVKGVPEEDLANQLAAALGEAGGTGRPAVSVSTTAGASSRTVPAPSGAPIGEVDAADDLRGHYFRQLLLKPLTLISIVAGPLVVGALFYLMAGPVLGGFMLLLSLFLGVLIVRHKAGEHAADDFNHAYARSRNYRLGGSTYLGSATPLLRKGDEQYAEQTFVGELGQGVSGLLAIYTYVVETTDAHGNQQRDEHPFTLGMVEVPECAAHVPELYCRRKFGLHSMEKVEDAFRRSKERVEFESDALDDKYEIFCGKGQDENWLRRLFSPTFIVWLTDSAPEHFAFELVDGTLVAYVHGHKEDTADLDRVAAASATVATRLREESTE